MNAQNDTINQIISAYDKLDYTTCNKLINSFNEKSILLNSIKDSIDYNLYKCIKGYQMPNEKFKSQNYSSQYFNSIKYLYKIGLGDYLTSYVNDIYDKSDLFTPKSSPIYKSEILNLLEESLKYSIKDLNYDKLFTKIERFYTLKNISYLHNNVFPEKYDKTLIKINETLNFYSENRSFFESKGINDSYLYFLLKLKVSLLYKIENINEKKSSIYQIINLIYKYKNEVDKNYLENLDLYLDVLGHDSYKSKDFDLMLDLIDKHHTEISEFDLFFIKEIIESTTISQKQLIIEKLIIDLDNNKLSKVMLRGLSHLMDYLIIPYGKINDLKVKSAEEKKLIIHYYYIRYLLEKNNEWNWIENPDYRIISKKVTVSSFELVYNSLQSSEIDINFKDGYFDFLKEKGKLIQEIINTKNPNINKLVYTDFVDKINYEIREHKTELNKSDDEFIISVLNNNINLFNNTNPKYNDFIALLSIIYTDILKLTLGLDNNIRDEKINKLNIFIHSKLKDEINVDDLNLRINICNSVEDYNYIKDFINQINKNNELSVSNYIKLNNELNFIEYFITNNQKLIKEELNNNINSNEYLLSIAKKTYNYFISNIETFSNYRDYNRIIELIIKFNFEVNLQLINKYLTFYNNPGNLLNNIDKFNLDLNLGKLYYRIKNYSKAKMYFTAANANSLIYNDVIYAFQKWDILLNIFYCDILDNTIQEEEKKQSINYIIGVFEDDIDRISNIKSENISSVFNEIKYKYNIISIYKAKEQNELIKAKNLLIEQINLNNLFHFFENFYNELDLNECKLKLNEISNNEKYILNTELYKKYNKSPDILYAIDAEKIDDYNTSFNIQLNIYTKELITNLKFINKLSYSNQFVFFSQIWDHRQSILRPYFKLSNEEQTKYSQKLIEYFMLTDNIDGYNSNLYLNNENTKIDDLIIEKKKLINSKIQDEDFYKISNNIDFLQQNLKSNENNLIWTYQLLKKNLKENQAYIRIFFNYDNYYAFVVTKMTLKLIDLNSNNVDFQKVFAAYMKNIKEQEENPLAYDIFYSKIFSALPKEINELFFQNEGVYINLNPDGFKSNSSNKYLIESYDIHTINTSYNFTNLNSIINFKNALFIGNPKFKNTGTQIPKTSLIDNNTRGSLLPLPNTQIEVLEVSKLLTNESISTRCLLQAEATESNLNTLSSDFDLIHIATHGFYKDDESDQINQYDFGLFLSGALDYLNNNQEKSQMINEGIIYAPEIELLNLSKAKLVILSACETGYGKQSNIGKISLTSSFIMAGAKNVLSTLWKVDDKVTMEFINAFYRKLLQLKNIKRALKETQLEFLEKYKSPYYWAPFMLLQNRG